MSAESSIQTLSAPNPGVDLAGEILAQARSRDATHVHIEPHAGGTRVRMRIGGQLSEALSLPAPVDLDFADHGVDVARLATPHGERMVLHLPEPAMRFGELEALGMPSRLALALGSDLSRGGLMIIAGPDGSGKATTLRALLREADDGTRNVLTAQTTDEIRAALRQDPDVLMIASIADRETAALAVQAAGAGHLVLGGIDARDAVAAIHRLRDWRVEPFQLASTLRAVVAQRLVKRLCRSCREPVQAQGSVSSLLGFDSGAVVYAPVGCDQCDGGYAGRTAVFEAIHADAALRRLINDGGDGAIIARHAFLNAPNLGSAARTLVRQGIITPEEAVRISRS
ncbi:ATPase, T2SS/T4P/T4SS family [Sphingomonas sp. AOB5]|uniref:GspE/PulE family protein n=1 Tax=Sphingomonas sp. AOB5 TaxID=3034017 RepID=UPI0023F8622B|nr:ATPase, T2SS/T4P/T4SS family [Sphingomonas sp. AOB5]MDF7774327.1 ATPase, T2SS/T4P/T4SS family [Sphingomonas sp. AOB5]